MCRRLKDSIVWLGGGEREGRRQGTSMEKFLRGKKRRLLSLCRVQHGRMAGLICYRRNLVLPSRQHSVFG